MSAPKGTQAPHPLKLLLEQTHRARDLLVRAYEHEGSSLTEDERLKCEPLIAAHFLRRDSTHGVRLNQRLQKVFDGALRRNRITAIDTNLGEELGVAELSMLRFQDAKAHGRLALAETCEDDIRISLQTISDILNDGAQTIYRQVTARFGLQENKELRRKENEYYLRQLNNLIQSFNEVRKALYEEPFTLDHEIKRIVLDFDIRSIEVVGRINDIQNTIKAYLYQIRILEQRACQIRVLGDHLRENPGFHANQAETASAQAEAFLQIEPIKVQGIPDLSSTEGNAFYEEVVADLARRLSEKAPQKKRAASELISHKQEEVVRGRSDTEKVMEQILAHCFDKKAPQSARDFWPRVNKLGETRRWSVIGFLYALAGYLNSNPLAPTGRPVKDYIDCVFRSVGRHPLSGTQTLLDIVVFPAGRWTPEQALDYIVQEETAQREGNRP